jgi:hypothetical protein
MTIIVRTFPPELEDALYSLVIAAKVPDAAALDVLVRRYPQFSEELTDIAVSLAIEALEDDMHVAIDVQNTSPAVSRAMSQFNNKLHEIGTIKQELEKKSAINLESPFAALDRDGIKNLASRLHANTLFVLKLRDRIIDGTTISDGFKNLLTDALSAPANLMAAHFSGQQEMALRAHYKADQKPAVVKQQSFEEAVRTSNLTPEQQSYLLSL